MIFGPRFIRQRPLLILDADGVLLEFVDAFERYASTKGMYLEMDSFHLHGNIYNQATGQVVDPVGVKALLDTFFIEAIDTLEPVPHAADVLDRLSKSVNIVVLSNVPKHARRGRAANLARHGIPYPVLSNKGEKGIKIKNLSEKVDKSVAFVDDLPPQLSSAARHAPHVHRIHMIAEQSISHLLDPAPDAHARIDNWLEMEDHLRHILDLD